MARLQLALNVPDIDQAVDFYRRLFDTEPNKRKPGYANFAIADPPLKLVLFEKPGSESRLNHLGVEVATPADVARSEDRLRGEGVEATAESGTCCFATQEKVWVDAPDGAWEIYAVLADSDEFGVSSAKVDDAMGDSLCCAATSTAATATASCC